MFVKLIFEDFDHFENRKRVTLTRPAIAGQLKTARGVVLTGPLPEHCAVSIKEGSFRGAAAAINTIKS